MSLTTTTDVQTEGSKEVHIWKCTAADCNAWIKDEYVTEASPSCPLCKSAMERAPPGNSGGRQEIQKDLYRWKKKILNSPSDEQSLWGFARNGKKAGCTMGAIRLFVLSGRERAGYFLIRAAAPNRTPAQGLPVQPGAAAR
ncbi:cold-inducible protein YdjO-related protein [Paenibacillus sp. TAB 01]|uniref:cold-inducible protein YdjO-related protein n=1 Tax=Paenibacillus sp. TAB 01 TaxID=3368988 RepID=UPI00375340D4